MTIATIRSYYLVGLDVRPITITATLDEQSSTWTITNHPHWREAKARVQSALANSDFRLSGGVHVELSEAPPGGPPALDLPIALAVLGAAGLVDCRGLAAVGELSLDGAVLSVPGVVSYAEQAGRDEQCLMSPDTNEGEAGLVPCTYLPVRDLTEAAKAWPALQSTGAGLDREPGEQPFDFADIRGQALARRGLEVAAAGGHPILLVGPPGSGKTMLARRLSTILPPMTQDERLDVARLYSGVSAYAKGRCDWRPFCAPHHTVSAVGMIGGGAGVPRPGQVSLAHNGVLFLDEFPEFRRDVIESTTHSIEAGEANLRRGDVRVSYPAQPHLVAAMNPCPCGYDGHEALECADCPKLKAAYRDRIAAHKGAFDMCAPVEAIPYSTLVSGERGEDSASIRARVVKARQRQRERFAGVPGVQVNADMEPAHLRQFCGLEGEAHGLMEQCIDVLGLSARQYESLVKVARTIADLADSDTIEHHHVAEAVGYRVT